MGNNLKLLRNKRSWTLAEAAEAMGVSRGQYIKLENGERQLKLRYIEIAARAFGVSASSVFANDAVKIVGYVGAGSQAHYYADGNVGDDMASSPPNATENTVAVEIIGDSLGSMFNRWRAYYDDVKTPPTTNMYRRLCVVGLADGRVLIKKIIPGSAAGLFHLESQTEGVMEDVPVLWAAEVKALLPKG